MKGLITTLLMGTLGMFSSLNSYSDPVFMAAGSVEGTVILAPRQVPVRFGGGNRYGRPSAVQNPSSGVSEDSVLVWLESLSGPGTSVPNKLHILDQKNLMFVPALLPIRQHDTVRIINSDPVYHNVFSLSSLKRFDVGRRPKGEYRDEVFNKPGQVNVFCEIHSNMHAVIYVMGSSAVTWTKVKSGEPFVLKDVPPGSYRLNIYALGYNEESLSVEITSGETTRLSTLTLTS